MLTQEDNELLCHVGPGTIMGDLIREYWIPAFTPSELPTPDCSPMRLRLLGENLVAFRLTSGKVGLIQNACPHRGASLFFGRNEEEGLRCVYHGWKFDESGACVDMPSEPAESNFKNKVHARAYPCVERNGMVWTYMGPRETPPPLPDIEANLSPECMVINSTFECNFVQALEGNIDTVHSAFLHGGHHNVEDFPRGSELYYQYKQRYARYEVLEHEVGMTYGAYRPAEEDTDCWRIGHFLLPFNTMSASNILTKKTGVFAYVPIDDHHTRFWGIVTRRDQAGNTGIGGLFTTPRRLGYSMESTTLPSVRGPFLPETSDWLGKYRPVANESNDYLIDREAQKNRASYTGMPGGNEPEDRAVVESMGAIWDRTQEHLGTSDSMIIQTRKKLIRAAKALRTDGITPPGVDKPELYRMYSGGALVPKGVSGIQYCKDHLFGHDAIPIELTT